MKLIISGVFALALCWGVAKFVNVGSTAFTLAQIPISWTMVVFCVGLAFVIGRVR